MIRLVAIDPGTRLCGWAVFNDGWLHRCGLVRSKNPDLRERIKDLTRGLECTPIFLGFAAQLIVERPEVYPQRQQKGDPNDLITLAIVVGAIVARANTAALVHLPLPKEWKGQVPKDVGERRMLNKLSEVERLDLANNLGPVPKSLRHNVMDAVALGLWGLDR